MTIEFKSWGKIPRLFRSCIITEKIDGTNSAVGIVDVSQVDRDDPLVTAYVEDLGKVVYAQSRKRIVTPDQDNYDFASWVREHAEDLAVALGDGLHFGEYWGRGIGRNYGLDHRRFSLFNVERYKDVDFSELPNVGLVPILYRGMFSTWRVEYEVEKLRYAGSSAVPGYMDPEGVITFHVASNQVFKTTLKNDETPKGSNEPG